MTIGTLEMMGGTMKIYVDLASGEDAVALAVFRGAKFLCTLPETENPSLWKLISFDGTIIASHPDRPPATVDEEGYHEIKQV